jgi:hypothetical protein
MKRVKTHWNGNMENHADKHQLKQQIKQSNMMRYDLFYKNEDFCQIRLYICVYRHYAKCRNCPYTLFSLLLSLS